MENNTKKDRLKKFLEAVGKNIKEERKKAKMTQHDLAVIARIDLNTISNIENNKSPARLDTIYKIANAFKIDPTRLVATSKICHNDIDDIRKQLKEINKKLDNIV